jgi:hypothetical protein
MERIPKERRGSTIVMAVESDPPFGNGPAIVNAADRIEIIGPKAGSRVKYAGGDR